VGLGLKPIATQTLVWISVLILEYVNWIALQELPLIAFVGLPRKSIVTIVLTTALILECANQLAIQ